MVTQKKLHYLVPVWGLLACFALALPTHATIFEDFLFDDPAGTALTAAVNSANPGNLFDEDTDTIDVTTNGLGQLDASLKNNTAFGTNYVDNAAITAGKVFGVMELTWDFQSVLDPAENEQLRISLIDADPRSTRVTSEFRITRTDTDVLTIEGVAVGTGTTSIVPVTLNGGSLTQSDKFIAVVAADLDADTYEILYSADAGGTFLSAGTGSIDSTRVVESMRMTLNNNLMGDNVLIDRVYLTDVSPVTSVDALTLEVNSTTGEIVIKNDTTTSFDINSYRIESPDPDHDLNFAGWNSLSDRAIDAVDGVDADSIVGNGIGETWDEAAGSDDDVLAESFLQGSSVFGQGRSVTLGNAFKVGGAETLEFQYRDAATGAISDGNVVYVTGSVPGDYDGDGFVGQGDLDLVLLNWGDMIPPDPVPAGWVNEIPSGIIGQANLDGVLLNWGNGTPPIAAASAVPEPSMLTLLGLGSLGLVLRRRASAQ